MIFLALQILSKDEHAKIAIITCSKLLAKQVLTDFGNAIKNYQQNIQFYNTEEIELIGKADYFFIDEADLSLEKPVSFAGSHLNGLYHLRYAK